MLLCQRASLIARHARNCRIAQRSLACRPRPLAVAIRAPDCARLAHLASIKEAWQSGQSSARSRSCEGDAGDDSRYTACEPGGAIDDAMGVSSAALCSTLCAGGGVDSDDVGESQTCDE